MGDGEPFPDFFFSRAPLPERVNLTELKGKLYWELSLDGAPDKAPRNVLNLAPYDDNDNEMLDCCELEDNYEINPTKSGKFITSFYVPKALHSIIIGPKGSKLRQLQDITNTLIKVPKTAEETVIKITGPNERSVATARTQISLLLLSRREKMSITHFISIRIFSDDIKSNFLKFKQEILRGPPTRGVDASIFQRVEKFHLTIVTLTLLDDKELEDAKRVLDNVQESVRKIFAGKKPRIVLQGLEIMNDDPAEVDVLYGKVVLDSREDLEGLQEVADEVLDVFYNNGLVKKQYDNVKLHVTLMNSLFRKGDDYGKEKQKRETFDASYILDNYKDFYFGKTTLDKIYLSVRFTTTQDGYYDYISCINV